MPERKINVEVAPGQTLEGYEVAVDESTERWSEYKLSDGTVIKGKMTIISAVRMADQFDPQGNPMYQMNMTPTIVIMSAPDDLKRRMDP